MVFINKMTDYAFRIVMYLSGCQRPRSIDEICEGAGVSSQETQKVIRKLKSEKIVEKTCAGYRGYVMVEAPEKISVLRIMKLFMESVNINRCLEADQYCDRDGPSHGCVVRRYLQEVQSLLEGKLNDKTFQDLYSQMKIDARLNEGEKGHEQ